MVKTLFLIGNQPDNLGDVILNGNLLQIYQSYGDVYLDDHYLTAEYVSGLRLDSKYILSQNNQAANPRTLWGKLKLIFSLKRPYDIISRYPGHYIYKPSPKAFMHEVLMAIFYTFLKIRGYRVVLVGVTISTEPLKGLRLFLEKWQARMHSLYSVRDKTVLAELHKKGIFCAKHIPDVFLLATPEQNPVSLEGFTQRRQRKVVICLRPDVHESLNPDKVRERTKEQVVALVNQLDVSINVVFSYQVDRDHAFNEELYEACKERGNTQFIPNCQTVESARTLYEKASVLISNRLHCLLYGVTIGTPVIAFTDWNGHKKIVGAWKDFELNEYAFDIFDDIDICMKLIGRLMSEELKYREVLHRKAIGIKRQVEKSLTMALKI